MFMKTSLAKYISVVLIVTVLLPAPAFGCDGWFCKNVVQPIDEHVVQPVVTHVVQPVVAHGKEGVKDVITIGQGTGGLLLGTWQVITLHPSEGWKTIQDGGKTII